MIKTQYPYDWFLAVTEKWRVKVLITLALTVILFIIWMLQPRFGPGFTDKDTWISYSYSHTQRENGATIYVYICGRNKTTIESHGKSYIITLPDTSYEVFMYKNSEDKVVDISNGMPVDLTQETFRNALLSWIIASDSRAFTPCVIAFLILLGFCTIGLVYIFYSDRINFLGIYARPVFGNVISGLIPLVCAVIVALRCVW